MKIYGGFSSITGRTVHASSGTNWSIEKLLALYPTTAHSGPWETSRDMFDREAQATVPT